MQIRNLILSFIALVILSGCDKGYTAINYIENKTDSLIICDYYRGDTINVSYRIEANSKVETYNRDDIGNPSYDLFIEADKIKVEGYGDSSIWMYPQEESTIKSMFDRNNWEQTKDGDDIYISTYVFE